MSLSGVFLAFGIYLAIAWSSLFQSIVNYELSVSNTNTKGYQMWKETPIPMYMEFYIFNWTNAHLGDKYPGVKPAFVEMGPYVFYEHHIRENVTFNDNDTVTYLNKRTWKFEPSKSSGTLDDVLTMLNPVPIIVADKVKSEHYLVKKAVNYFFIIKGEKIYIQKSVREILFDGYDDPLIDIASKLNISSLNLPFTKFAWFVDRNNSATYDGVYNMYSGGKDPSKLGIITKWNYEHKTSYYPGDCGIVNGSSGELWYAVRGQETVSIFSPDMCSDVTLHRNGTETLYGIKGSYYMGMADLFDNGTYFPNASCFASGMPTGVRGVASCKFGAPAYMSFPHFYLADPIYRHNVDGMKPNRERHTSVMLLEPNTGLPLKVNAAFQLNLLLRNVEGIDMYSQVKTTLMPCFWFAQKAQLTEDLSSLAKLLLIGGSIGTNTGYGLIGLGALFLIIFGVVTCRTVCKSNDDQVYLIEGENS